MKRAALVFIFTAFIVVGSVVAVKSVPFSVLLWSVILFIAIPLDCVRQTAFPPLIGIR